MGVAIGRAQMRLAEVSSKGDRQSVEAAAEFVYPEGLSLATPEELGKALKAFLKGKGFSAREAVLGLSAEWLITRVKSVPPAPANVAASALRLQAESEFSNEADELVVDFAGTTSATAAASVLLIATARRYLEQAQTMTRAAGLQASSIGATALALAELTRSIAGGHDLIVSLDEDGAEMIVQQDDAPAQLRHYATGEDAGVEGLGALVGEVRRTVTMLPKNGSPVGMALWRDGRRMATAERTFADRLGMPVRVLEVKSAVGGNAPEAQRCVGAVALAMAETGSGAVDFMHSRLAAPSTARSRRPIVWGGGIAAALLLVVVGLGVQRTLQKKQLASLNERYRAISGDSKNPKQVQRDEATLKRLETAKAWASTQPFALASVRDVTALLPDDGIWVTNFRLQADGHGQVDGKSTSRQRAMALFDDMKKNKRFAEPKMAELRDVTRTSPEFAFSISFVYRGE